jgi:hypothetical protein
VNRVEVAASVKPFQGNVDPAGESPVQIAQVAPHRLHLSDDFIKF